MIAFDTNVLIYACDQGDPKRQLRAVDLITGTSDGTILWQVAIEFIAASRKLHRPDFGPDRVWAELFALLKVFPLTLPSHAVLVTAKKLSLEAGMSHWDALIVAGCLEAGVRRLYSEDLPGQAIEGLEIINPFA